jgi:nucleotide-binding universal stress UspA family protein
MYKHIMLAVDGSELSRKAQQECFAFARSIDARVTVINVVSRFHLHFQPWAAPQSVHAKIEEQHDSEARQIAAKMVADIVAQARSAGVACEDLVVVGDHPYEEIIKGAEQRKCDLIMMASHGHRGIDAVLLGSEVVKVLTHSKIPVLVVR